MQKQTIILLLAVLVVSLVGCGGVSESDHQAVISERDSLKIKLASIQEETASLKDENDALKNKLEEQKQEIARLIAREAAEQIEAEKVKSKETPRLYEVKSGDSLWSISKQFQVPVATLKELNNLQDSNINIGQQILLR